MSEYTTCQVCGKNQWQVIASRIFCKSDFSDQNKLAKSVSHFMFEQWLPGRSEILFENLYCNNCGFIRYSPRPTEQEMDKHRGRRIGDIVGTKPGTDLDMIAKRSSLLFDYLNRNIDLGKVNTVLDYGGTDGNMLRIFAENKFQCYLVDYCPYHIPEVNKIGNTVYEIPEDDKFDLIICSHVLEHVTDPQKVVKELIEHLTETGILFIELPLELWKRPPLLNQSNPITHLNFFSLGSLKNMLIACGAHVEKCRLIEYMYGSSTWNPGLRCIATRKNSASKDQPHAKPDAMEFLKPNLKSYFKYYWHNPKRFKTEIAKRLRK